MPNECAKTRPLDDPYEIWVSFDGSWEWRVLKKWQIDDDKPYGRWFCGVKSPYTHGEHELGDVYVQEIKQSARKVDDVRAYLEEQVAIEQAKRD